MTPATTERNVIIEPQRNLRVGGAIKQTIHFANLLPLPECKRWIIGNEIIPNLGVGTHRGGLFSRCVNLRTQSSLRLSRLIGDWIPG